MTISNLNRIPGVLLLILCCSVLMSGCSGGGGSSSGSATLSSDQAAFEKLALQGGGGLITWEFPFGGATLVDNTNYIYSTNTYNLSASPLTAGPQLSTASRTTMSSALSLPPLSNNAFLSGGKIVTRSVTASRRVSYVNDAIQIDYLSDGTQQTLYSAWLSNFSMNTLSGVIATDTPEELLAQYHFQDWVKFGNLAANASWITGSAYAKYQFHYVSDVYGVQSYNGSALSSSSSSSSFTPCATNKTLDSFFPFTPVTGNSHPSEVDFIGDGTISYVQGLRMWIANKPLFPSVAQQYRIFFEYQGDVYGGYLIRSGTQAYYSQTDGTWVNYGIQMLNQQALSSITSGLITNGTSSANAQQGDTAEIPVSTTIDLFGIGGHGLNGSLSPADLVTHYGIPSGLNGSGQTVAVIEAPGTGNYLDDLNTFSSYYNLPAVSLCSSSSGSPCLTVIDQSGGATTSSSGNWGSEIAMDIQTIHAIAPMANILIVIAASGLSDDLFNAINTASVISGVTAVFMSFSGYQYSCSQDSAFSDAIINKGMIFLASSGDNGNYNNSIYYPASSPFVTAVGGTAINSVVYSSTASETAWQFTGGGLDTSAPYCSATASGNVMPTWQSASVGSTIASLNSNQRAVPDVAAVADPHQSAFAYYWQDVWRMGGGTSLSAPIWGGIVALYGQYLANQGTSLSTLIMATSGGFNALLYQTKLNGSGSFRDVVSGNNNLLPTSCALCSATAGFDDLTGLGVPNVTLLFANLH